LSIFFLFGLLDIEVLININFEQKNKQRKNLLRTTTKNSTAT